VGEGQEQSDAYDFCGAKQLSVQLSAVPYQDTSLARVVAAALDAPADPHQHALVSNSPMWVGCPVGPPSLHVARCVLSTCSQRLARLC
jgi:hypothetical protein